MICQFASPVEIVDIHKQPEVFLTLIFVLSLYFTFILFSGSCFRRQILEKKI